ncbi:hypothetical protein MP228_013057 [Amoeboaphelidium protococcarum]|nr:hypothetical protein MP228_013057 [Amoeboaphelidium protococcarum]
MKLTLVVSSVVSVLLSTLINAQTGAPDDATQMLSLINAVRVNYGLEEVCLNAKLNDAGSQYAQAMAKANRFETQLNGQSVSNRVETAGFKTVSATLEALTMGHQSADDAFQSIMDVPSTRSMVIDSRIEFVGVGMRDSYWDVIFSSSPTEKCLGEEGASDQYDAQIQSGNGTNVNVSNAVGQNSTSDGIESAI